MHSATLETSDRLKRLLAFLRERGQAGATTREIATLARIEAVSAAVDELRDNGLTVSCVYEGKGAGDSRVYRYRLEESGQPASADGESSPLLDSDPPAPLVDADPPPEVPAHMIGDVIRFERMPRSEKALYQRICEGRAEDGSCLLCAYVISGEHEDIFPPAARKAHVLVCCDPALDSNAEYLRPRHADPSESRDPLPAARTTHPGLTVGVGSA